MLIDPLALGAFTWGVFGERLDLLVGGLAVYLINAPLIHLLSGEFGNAGWSFVARVLAVPTVFAILVSINLPARITCHTPIACRNTLYGVVATGLVGAWMHDLLNAERAPSEKMRLWAATPAVSITDRGDTAWGLALRF